MNLHALARRCALVVPLALAGLTAQVSQWSMLPVPSGVVSSNLRQIGKVITYTDANQLHAYSAFAHRWTSLTVSGVATLRVANDLALAVDGTTFHAFSSYTGSWSSLVLSPNAVVVNPGAQQNDSIWLVRDGNTIWAYAAFRGQWASLSVGPSAFALVERHVAMVVDGQNLHALSALNGNWVSTTASNPPSVARARGTAAVAASSVDVHGFSALTNAWTSAAGIGASPTLTLNDDLQLVQSGANVLGFSGLRGTFAPITLPAVTITASETVAFATDNVSQHWVYSAVRGAWTALPSGAIVTSAVGGNAVVLGFSDRVHAFSGVTGSVATTLIAPSIVSLGRAVGALVAQDGSIKFFSVLLGQWFDAPSGSAGSPEVSDVAGFVRTTSGLSAFSPRTGRFVPLAASASAQTIIAAGNAVQAVIDANTLYTFDPRRERWQSAPLQSIPSIGTHRTTLIALDGTTAYGYGAFTGKLSAITLPVPGSIVRPNSESASVETPNAIFAHSSVPDILTLWQFPEFRRVYTAGTPLELQIQASDGSGFCFLGLRLLQTPVVLGALGELELDATAGLIALPTPVPISQGFGSLRLTVPSDPALRGLEFAFQAVVVPSAAAPYLTQSTSVLAY